MYFKTADNGQRAHTGVPWPRVHKETESEDQAQDQTYKMQVLDKKSYKFDEFFAIFSGGWNLKAIETKVKLPFWSFEILR